MGDVSRQVSFLIKSNQKREALSAIQLYFNNPDFSNFSKESYNFLIINAIHLSVQFLVPIPNILKSILNRCDSEEISKLFLMYIQEGRIMIGDQQQYSAQAKDVIHYPIPSSTVDDLLVSPLINFFNKIFVSVLECLRENNRINKLYFNIITNGYQAAIDLESQQLHDYISKELDHLCGDPKLEYSIRYKVVDSLFLRFRTALDLGLYKRAFRALCDASILISSHDSPIELHEHLEVQKTILLQIRENRLPAAIQLLNLINFYEKTPIPPSMPIQSLIDLALLTALASGLETKEDTSYEKLLGCKTLSREQVIEQLLSKVQRLTLKKFTAVAEEHKNPTEICLAFRNLLSEYGKEFQVPILFKSLGRYTAYRVIQASLQQKKEVTFAELEHAIKWMNLPEIHRIIINGNKINLYKCKIDMMKNCIVSFNV